MGRMQPKKKQNQMCKTVQSTVKLGKLQVAYLAGIFSMQVGERGHARGVRPGLGVLLLRQGGVNGCKLALQPLHLHCSC